MLCQVAARHVNKATESLSCSTIGPYLVNDQTTHSQSGAKYSSDVKEEGRGGGVILVKSLLTKGLIWNVSCLIAIQILYGFYEWHGYWYSATINYIKCLGKADPAAKTWTLL